MDLSGLSVDDLKAIQAGDLSKVSADGLQKLAGSAAPVTKPAPEDPGFLQSMLIGAGRTFDRIGKGAQQVYYAATGNNDAASKLKATAQEDDAIYKGLQSVRPWATGIGEALPSLAIPASGGATLTAAAGRMALAGALPGALEYGTPEERVQRAKWGAATGAAVPFIGAGLQVGKAAIEPFYQGGKEAILSRLLNRVAGSDAAAVASKMDTALPLVPGSMPTAAQAAENGGIGALERSAAAMNPTPYTMRALEQSQARQAALATIAKDSNALDAAVAARKAAASPLYDQAAAATVSKTPDMAAVLDRLPGDVWAKAKRLATLDGTSLQIGKDLPERVVAGIDATGVPVLQTMPAQASQLTGKGLHYLKLALDDTIGAAGQNGIGAVEQGLTKKVQGDLLSQIDNAIPAYAQARQTFAKLSEPINQMQIGQELADKMRPALADYGALGRETAATYATALRNGDQVAQRVTGMPNATLYGVMTPAQMQTLEAIAKDLGRKANAQDLGKGVGSDTFQKLAMNNIAQQSGMPSLVGGLLGQVPGTSHLVNWAYGNADQKMQGLLADALLNPQQTAALMRKTQTKMLANNPKTRKVIEQTLLRSGLLSPALTNQSEAAP